MGAMASKKASELASSLRAIAVASASEVSGPVATMPGDASSVTSPRARVIPGWPVIRSCTPCANAARSTASAAPPGTRAWSAASSTTLPSRRISALSSPWALVSSTDLKELEQTSSANRSVWCAAVIFAGRISCSVTAIPRPASAQRHGPRVLARGELGASEELAVAPRLDHHGRAALLADLVGGPVGHLVPPQRPREAALVGVAGAGDEGTEPPAPHHQAAPARGALLLVQVGEVVHVVDQLLHVHRVERLGERPPEVAQHLLPREIAFLHLVELIFHLRRESHH